jgi:Protein of unknown function (DUF3987)
VIFPQPNEGDRSALRPRTDLHKRELPDWLTEFVRNTEWGEAPIHMYFWVGIGTIAAALRRRVWLDMGTFTWYPNLYTLLVAPPGIIAKSSTVDLGFNQLLRKIPGINMGPSTLTWQALYDAFAEVGEEFQIPGNETAIQAALTIQSSEFGITLNPKDNEMIDQLVHIWDGREMKKRTRKDGELLIPAPCLNLIACTTPAWIAENMPRYLIGGGLTSRMIFVYAEEKARYIAYPQDHMPSDFKDRQGRLIRDLERISTLTGGFTLTKDAKEWGKEWYEHFHKVEALKLDKSILGGYIARKQTMVHKVAMCLSVSLGDSLTITRELLERSAQLLTALEDAMPQVYSQLGQTQEANGAQQVLEFLSRYDGQAPFTLVYRYMHTKFPDPSKFDSILEGLMDAGYITINRGNGMIYKAKDL